MTSVASSIRSMMGRRVLSCGNGLRPNPMPTQEMSALWVPRWIMACYFHSSVSDCHEIGSVPTPWPSWLIAAHPSETRAPTAALNRFLNALTGYIRSFDADSNRFGNSLDFIQEKFGYPEEDIKESWHFIFPLSGVNNGDIFRLGLRLLGTLTIARLFLLKPSQILSSEFFSKRVWVPSILNIWQHSGTSWCDTNPTRGIWCERLCEYGHCDAYMKVHIMYLTDICHMATVWDHVRVQTFTLAANLGRRDAMCLHVMSFLMCRLSY